MEAELEEQELYGTEQRKPYFCPNKDCRRWLFDIYRSSMEAWHTYWYGMSVDFMRAHCPYCGERFEFGTLHIAEHITKADGVLLIDSEPEN